jgi:uncharacterized protein (DUF849 family)
LIVQYPATIVTHYQGKCERFHTPHFRRDRQNKTGGGVIVYVKEYINCIVRPDLQIDNIECLWIEIKLKKKSIYMEPFTFPLIVGHNRGWILNNQLILP